MLSLRELGLVILTLEDARDEVEPKDFTDDFDEPCDEPRDLLRERAPPDLLRERAPPDLVDRIEPGREPELFRERHDM